MNRNRCVPRFFVGFIGFLFLVGCSSGGGGGSASSSSPPVAYCSTQSSYDNPLTITGQAQYEYRSNGNGSVASPNPIRRAEVRVTDSAGNIIQCGETLNDGSFSLSLPNNGSSVTVTIASRADNSYVKAYVLNNPTNNVFHSITSTVTLDSSKSIGTLTAPATGELQGGAFNILDKILDSNEFLRNETANCGSTYNCTTFSVAPLVTAYWAAGVNPGDYFGISALSFFLPDENELYILGGVNGDVDSSDTDHFDNTIIIHEYGHFLENNFSTADSPGGQHNGDNILDPRLAWSEAFANYFQAAVTGSALYRDTFGTPEGNSGVLINENLESGTTDTPTEAGEGNFREFAMTRALLDLTDTNNEGSNDDLTTPFEEIWTLLTSTTEGLQNSNEAFRAMGLFNALQSGLSGGSNWSTIQTAEELFSGLDNYGNTLSSGSGCPTSILAEDVPGASVNNNPGRQPEDGTPENSNQFKSNDFYRITHSGGSLTINLSYTTTGGNAADLDIYLYQEDYVFGVASTVAGFSDSTIATSASSGSETMSLSSLAAGNYMLNVNYNTLNGIRSAASYSLTINNQSVCPD